MHNPNTLGKMIRKTRHKENITMKELAAKTGVGYSRLSQIENGIVWSPSLEILTKLAVYMGLTTLELAKCVDLPNEKLQNYIDYLDGQEELR